MRDQTQQPERLAEYWASAELRSDVASLGEILAEDFVGVDPRGFTLTRESSGSPATRPGTCATSLLGWTR